MYHLHPVCMLHNRSTGRLVLQNHEIIFIKGKDYEENSLPLLSPLPAVWPIQLYTERMHPMLQFLLPDISFSPSPRNFIFQALVCIFQALVCTFQALVCTFQALVCTFQGLEYKTRRAIAKKSSGRSEIVVGEAKRKQAGVLFFQSKCCMFAHPYSSTRLLNHPSNYKGI